MRSEDRSEHYMPTHTGYSEFWIGIDDTDSPTGMCTTWLGAYLVRVLNRYGMQVLEARLIRLNPTIQYKTRGNAAIAIRVHGSPESAFHLTKELVERHSEFSCANTHPGLVVSIKKPPASFYYQAVRDICTVEEAISILNRYGCMWKGYKEKRGLIGALAAISSDLSDHTWELLSYRSRSEWGRARRVNPESLLISQEATSPHTWDTYDLVQDIPVCVPHSPDPILYGIRGDSPFWVAYASSCIRSEPYGLIQIWITNQGTDAHLIHTNNLPLQEGRSYLLEGEVRSDPETFEGGHVKIEISVGSDALPCMVFEPTKGFRDLIRALIPGDKVIVAGSFLRGSLNLEKVKLVSLAQLVLVRPPICPNCDKRMTSAGRDKGYKCRICGIRSRIQEREHKYRNLTPGWYEVPSSARRHLAKPLIRKGVHTDSISDTKRL